MSNNFRLDPDEVDRRKAFLEFTEKDVALLKALNERLNCGADAFVNAFYGHLLSFPELQVLLPDEATVERLKHTQTAYFCQLTAGNYDMAYIQNRLRVGLAHERVGLEPRWYIGAYCKYLSLILSDILAGKNSPNADTTDTLMALMKILFLDMGIAIDTYIDAKQQTIRTKSMQISALNQVAVAISSALGWQELLERIMKSGIALTGSKAACLAFYDEDSQAFGEWHTQGLSDYFVKHMSFRPGGLASKALESGHYILSNDRADSQYRLSELVRDEGIRSFLCLPFVSHTRSLGVLYLYRNDRDVFLQEEIELLETFAHLAAIAAENTRLHTSAMKLATTDALTGLLNRRGLEGILKSEQARAQRYGRDISLLILDIDHFKKINDNYGHISGDAVLKALAEGLSRQVRDIDKVARFGGEEFIIILPETRDTGAGIAAERVRKAVADLPIELPDGNSVVITISIGIACFPGGAGTLENVLEQADRALYQAKNSGRNRVCQYRDVLHT